MQLYCLWQQQHALVHAVNQLAVHHAVAHVEEGGEGRAELAVQGHYVQLCGTCAVGKLIFCVAAGCVLLGILVVVAFTVALPHSSQPRSASSSSQSDSIHHDTGQSSSSDHVDERGSRSSSGMEPTSNAHGLWHEGCDTAGGSQQQAQPQDSIIPCKGPNLQCSVVNKQPIPEVRALVGNVHRSMSASVLHQEQQQHQCHLCLSLSDMLLCSLLSLGLTLLVSLHVGFV